MDLPLLNIHHPTMYIVILVVDVLVDVAEEIDVAQVCLILGKKGSPCGIGISVISPLIQ
jgi:hypothetical protein